MKRHFENLGHYNPDDEFAESIRAGDFLNFQTSLQHGANPHRVNVIDILAKRVDSHSDMWNDDQQMVELLLQRGVDIYAHQKNPLITAMRYHKRPEMIRILLQAGANPFLINEKGDSAFSIAIHDFMKNSKPTHKTVELLAPFRHDLSSVAQHLLHFADPTTVSRFLLAHGTHPSFSQTLSEIIPILYELDVRHHETHFSALLKGALFHPVLMHFLLKQAPEMVDLTDDEMDGETALHFLVRDEGSYHLVDPRAIDELLSICEVDVQDRNGFTPLTRAVHILEELIESNDRAHVPFVLEMIQKLLAKHARVDLMGPNQESVIDILKRNQDQPEFQIIGEMIQRDYVFGFEFGRCQARKEKKKSDRETTRNRDQHSRLV